MNVLLSKVVVISVLLVIFYSLGSALIYLLKEGKHGECMARALTWRILLSLALFGLLFLFFFLGWLHPHPIIQQ
ncbi:MAG: twin transmembrane helix small protein [Gammaproteobacteria bacterium]